MVSINAGKYSATPVPLAASDFFWPKIIPGGMVLLDDYAFIGYELSKKGMDAFAAKNGVEILSLPTGQGLLIKPPQNA